MGSRLRAFLFTWLAYVAFFASGASCLIAEVTWNRMLIVVVGNSLSATAMILVVFMGGLGLGSYWGGRVFAKRRPSLRPYLLLEAAIGLYVLFSPALFDALARVFTSLADRVDDPAALGAVRILITLAALLVPAAGMGATFPAMISGAAPPGAARRSARTGYLYAVNTLGAAVGCFAAGYHLLFEFGVRFTLNCAGGLYAVSVLGALVASRLAHPAPEGQVDAAPLDDVASDTAGDDVALRRYLGVATFGIGFVALAYEVLLTRLSILYLGNAVSVFPLVLTAFLLGTGASALGGTRVYDAVRRQASGARRLFGVTSLAAGLLVFAIPYVLLTDRVVRTDDFARFADVGRKNPLPILAIIMAPTVLIGALLPFAIRMLRSGGGRATQGAATLYALNTAGGLVGAGIVNHVLVPKIGVQGASAALTAICAAVGLFALLSWRSRAWRWGVVSLGALVLGYVLAVAPPRMMDLYAAKVAASTRAASAEVRLVREGRAATVTVVDQSDPRLGTYRDMYLNGVEEASTRFWHTQLFKLLGILPVLAHSRDDMKDALVIAFGAGITAGSVLASDQVARLDVVDLNPDIEGINDLFRDVNGDVFHRRRFRFHNDDGRSYLVTHAPSYDLVIGDSTHPRAYDSWILYTEEFYRLVSRRLRKDGIFAQWVPVLGSMQGDLFRIHLNTFRRVFPHATFWYVYGSDQAFLLATPEAFRLDVARLQERLDRLPEWFRANEYQIDTVTRVAGFFWLDEAAMGRMIGDETRVNTDDVHYFDKQSAVWPSPPERRLPAFQASILPYLRGASPRMESALASEQRVALLLSRWGFYQSASDLHDAYCLMPDNGNARYFLARELAGELPDRESFCAQREIERYRALLARHPDNADVLNALADLLGQAGRLDEARGFAERAVALEPTNGMILDTWGWILFRHQETKAALDALERSAAALPNHPIVLYHLGAAHYAAGHVPLARRHLQRALDLSASFPGREDAVKLLAATR